MNPRRNSLLVGMLALLLAVSAAMADLQENPVLTWPQLQKEGKLTGGQVQPMDANGWQSLRIGNTGSASMRCPIVTLDRIVPTSNKFAVEGQIRYQKVQGDAYLEMWTVLPDGRWFFTRTVAETGPLQKISGTSGWRSFSLPFNLLGAAPKYVKLEIDVFMPGTGTIDLGPLSIGGLSSGPVKASNAWWSNQMGGWIGGTLGTAIGLMIALAAILFRKGASRKPIAAILLLVAMIGAVCLVAGIAAVINSQPYAVYYPLLLAGVLATAFALAGCVKLRRQRREVELRKMQAMDT